VSPSSGGSIFELDIFKINHNFLNVLTRKYEPYHKKLRENINKIALINNNISPEVQTIHNDVIKVKELNLDKYLVYDKYKRASLIDHFFPTNIKYDDCMFSCYEEKGDFASGTYNTTISQTRKFLKKHYKLILQRYGKVNGKDVKVTKEIIPISYGYVVKYEIKNNSKEPLEICFAPEQIFAFSLKTKDDFRDLKNIDTWKRYDDYLKTEIEVRFSDNVQLFVYPVETVSNSDNGYEKTYQGTVVMPILRSIIEVQKVKNFSLETIIRFK
jgi:alpha-amylase